MVACTVDGGAHPYTACGAAIVGRMGPRQRIGMRHKHPSAAGAPELRPIRLPSFGVAAQGLAGQAPPAPIGDDGAQTTMREHRARNVTAGACGARALLCWRPITLTITITITIINAAARCAGRGAALIAL